MTITLDLQPEIERGLLAQAQAKGVSLAAFAQEVLAREAKVAAAPPPRRTGQELIDVCAQVQGLLTDEEVDAFFSRNPLPGRPVDLE
jgi:hypothetical protein